MCWTGTIYDERIANRNITVYKIVGVENSTTYKAYYQDYTYKLGVKNEIDINVNYSPKTNGEIINIHVGLHCFSKNAYVQRGEYGHYVFVKSSYSAKNRLYSFDVSCYYKSIAVIKCTIPAGSRYFINKDGEIVTNTLILDQDLGLPVNKKPMRFWEFNKKLMED